MQAVCQSASLDYAIELKEFIRLVPRIAVVGTVERLARIGYSALEVSVWRRVFILSESRILVRPWTRRVDRAQKTAASLPQRFEAPP